MHIESYLSVWIHTPPPFNRIPVINNNITIAITTPKNIPTPSRNSKKVIPMKKVTYYSISKTSTILNTKKYGKNF